MKPYFAYVRISTAKQGEGVSIQEQRRSIEEFARKKGFPISAWFEEHITAAKRGRPIFGKMVSQLKAKKAGGLIIHKIDRGARNLRDWADIGELMDRGIEVHFAHESIDMHSRGGRLSADIMAVVASDYIRNLREETRKGFYGRLRQGLYPIMAPVGYMDNGSGKAKTPHPVMAPLVAQAFELYATKQYPLRALAEEMFSRGLRNTRGKFVNLNHLDIMLRNPFYMGLIRIRRTKETFAGIHKAIVSTSLFNKVQWVLDGRRTKIRCKHAFLYRKTITCGNCRYSLVGETHRGHTYYRCHTKGCPKNSWREERITEVVLSALEPLLVGAEEAAARDSALESLRSSQMRSVAASRRLLQEELGALTASLDKLLQHFLSGQIDKDTFDRGNASLLTKKRELEEKLDTSSDADAAQVRIGTKLAELCSSYALFHSGDTGERQTVLERCLARITATPGLIGPTLVPLAEKVAAREKTVKGWEVLFGSALLS